MAADTAGQRPLPIAPTLARIARLQAERRARDTQGRFFIEGIRQFVAAVDRGWAIDTLVYSERLLTAPLARKLVRRLKRAGVPFARLAPEQFRQISRAGRASGVGAILHQRVQPLEPPQPDSQGCWVALSQVRSPGNLGSLVRSAAAFGAAGFILLGDSVDPFEPAVVRASMGALFGQPFARADIAQLRRWTQAHQIPIVGASPDGSLVYDQQRYPRRVVLLVGEERRGLTEEQRALCQQIVRIPMAAGADSLNLAVAGSLLLSTIARQAQERSPAP